ncbi:MAG: metallophosphoesterase, partial [Proteobacteria bacterium]|nr:metallophosphoesterase [Pseudomonadota bacterium]
MVKTNDAGPYMAKTNNADPGKINTYRKNPEAVIIYPALGCSGIAAPDLDFDIFVLLHSNIPDEKINKDFFDKKFYCSTWDNQKDSRSGQPLEVKEPPKKIALGNDYIIEDRLHLSEVFWKEFKTKGYTKIYKIRLKAPATGFYNIYYNQPQKLEDELLNSILNGRPHALDGDKDFASLFNTGSTLSIRVNPKGEQQQGQQVRRYAPLYVTPKKYISFGLVGDPHTALHWYEFERRWNEYRNSSKIPRNQRNNCEFGDRCNEKFCVCGVCDNDKNFCNYNKEFLEALGNIEKDGNVEAVVILGDLIDCNRGYKSGSNVKDINNYQADCNWLHFYALILDSMKQKPYYTVLGNHDYRFNPYQPMPYLIGERFSIASDLNITRQELCKIYDEEETVYESGGLEDGVGKRSSLHISAQSVHWYHLVMNPFTDYVVHHEKMSLCFLDWDKDEVNLPIDNPELQFSDNLPWAKNSLSELQIKLLKSFKENSPDENVRVLFSHAPIINPYPQIGYEYLKDGKITCGTCRGRGYYSQRTSEGPTVVECAVCKGTKFQ